MDAIELLKKAIIKQDVYVPITGKPEKRVIMDHDKLYKALTALEQKPPAMKFTEEIQQIEAFILMRMIKADENNITVDGNKARKAEQNFGKIRRYIQKQAEQKPEIKIETCVDGRHYTSEYKAALKKEQKPDHIRDVTKKVEPTKLAEELASQIMDWENKEASICPEDFGFVEYIKYLTAELDSYHDAEKFVADPPHDQECCGCVPILRKQIAGLEAENRWISADEPPEKIDWKDIFYTLDCCATVPSVMTAEELWLDENSDVEFYKLIIMPKVRE